MEMDFEDHGVYNELTVGPTQYYRVGGVKHSRMCVGAEAVGVGERRKTSRGLVGGSGRPKGA